MGRRASGLVRAADLVRRQPDAADRDREEQGDGRVQQAAGADQGFRDTGGSERGRDAADVLADAEDLAARKEPGQDPLPDQRVGKADDQASRRGDTQDQEDRRVDIRAKERRQGERERRREARGLAAAHEDAGEDRRRDDQRSSQRAGDGDLREDDPPTLDRLRQDVNRRSIVELGSQRGCSEDERDERQDDANHEPVERRSQRLAAQLPLVHADEKAEHDRHRREDQHQDRPPPAEQGSQCDGGEDDERIHRRETRYAKTLSRESSVGATSNSVTPVSRATRATARVNPPNSATCTARRPSWSSAPNTAGSARKAAARRRSSDERTTNVCGRSVMSRRISRKSPAAASLPATITRAPAASRSTSSRMCEENRIVRPAADISRSSAIMWIRCRGSMPLKGSSRSKIDGSWTSAAAILARCRIPLEYVPIGRSAAPSSSTVAIARAAAPSGSGKRWSWAARRANSRPVKNECTASRSGTSPIDR